jgi:transposase
MSSQEILLPNLWSIMTTMYTIAAGLDIHKRFIMATILWASGEKIQRRFERTAQGILAIKEWILENKCQVVACESTSDYWVPIYDALCDFVTMIVGNAHDIKVQTHKKTDKIDSENIARLALKDMIKPSRVFTRGHRDFRKLVRLRHFLVRKRTDLKNRIHSILDGELFHLSDSLTDIFGKSGMNILNGLLEGKSADEIISTLPPQVRKKKQGDIRDLLAQSLSQVALTQLGHCLKVMTRLDEEIDPEQQKNDHYNVLPYP